MKVRDVMTTEVGYCQPDAALTQAAEIMWQRDCGVVPVVDAQQKVVGMITDRDICFAAVTQNRAPGEIKVGDVISQNKVRSCSPGDAVEDALKTMKQKQLRRLPVVNRDGVLVGILSLADLIRNAGSGKDSVPRKKLFAALKEISHLRPITLHILSPEDEENESAEKEDKENTSSESEDDADEKESDEDSSDDDSEDESDEDDDEDDDKEDEKDESDSDKNDKEKS
jgi:CBS domain-containing protein